MVYSLYDALVSINVPTEKAKAVIDAMEREMMDKIATKSDLEHARDILSKDIHSLETKTTADTEHTRELLFREIQSLTTKAELAEFGRKLTTQIYVAAAGSITLTCSILGVMLLFARR